MRRELVETNTHTALTHGKIPPENMRFIARFVARGQTRPKRRRPDGQARLVPSG